MSNRNSVFTRAFAPRKKLRGSGSLSISGNKAAPVRNRRRSAVAFLFLWCLNPTFALAQKKPLELKWAEIAPLVAGHHVEVTLRSGAKIAGEAVTVREDSLVIDVIRSSHKEKGPLGSTAVPRDAIVLIKLERIHGTWGRNMGTTIGVISGMVLGGNAGAHINSIGGALTVFGAVTSGVAVLGYFAGKNLDRKFTRIVIVP